MAAGDLITGNFQYEFNGILFGSGTSYITSKVTGLLAPPGLRSNDKDRQDAHGAFPGRRLYSKRRIEFDISIDGTPANIDALLQSLITAFTITDLPQQFVYQRPNGFGKRFAWCFVDDSDFDSTYDVANGLAVGSVALVAHDPRIYSLAETSTLVTIALSANTATANVTNTGKFDTAPILEIPGPATNPRVVNNTDNGKTLRVDVVLTAGQTLIVDMKARSVILNGVDRFDVVRTDNQWWKLKPGVNSITYNRTGGGAASSLNVRHRNAWVA